MRDYRLAWHGNESSSRDQDDDSEANAPVAQQAVKNEGSEELGHRADQEADRREDEASEASAPLPCKDCPALRL